MSRRFLLRRNVLNACKLGAIQSKQADRKLENALRWPNLSRIWRNCSDFLAFCVLESKHIHADTDLLLLINHCLSVSCKWINHSRFALVILSTFNDWPTDSDILSNKSLSVRIYFLNNLKTRKIVEKYYPCRGKLITPALNP